MAVATLTRRKAMTREAFERLPEGPPYYDFIDGEAIEANIPTNRHQRIEMVLGNAMFNFAHDGGYGEVYHNINVRLPSGNWVSPDIIFVLEENVGRFDEHKGFLNGSPDLAVEVFSPSNEDYDWVEKFNLYHRSDVSAIWLIDQRTLTIEEFVWTPTGYLKLGETYSGELFRSQFIQGFEINLLPALRLRPHE